MIGVASRYRPAAHGSPIRSESFTPIPALLEIPAMSPRALDVEIEGTRLTARANENTAGMLTMGFTYAVSRLNSESTIWELSMTSFPNNRMLFILFSVFVMIAVSAS